MQDEGVQANENEIPPQEELNENRNKFSNNDEQLNEINEEFNTKYEKTFKKLHEQQIEVLPTIIETNPVKEMSNSNLKPSNKKSLKNEFKKTEITKNEKKNNKPVVTKEKKIEKVSKKPSSLNEVKEKKVPQIDNIKVRKTIKEIHNFIEEAKDDSYDSSDNLLLRERENSVFFGKIGKMELPAAISSNMSPQLSDNEQISDHDLRINEIIEENRSDLFKIQTDQFYHEEITKITKKLANRNKLAAKNQTRKVN